MNISQANYDYDDENENAGEEAKHIAEIQRQKKEKEIEIAEEVGKYRVCYWTISLRKKKNFPGELKNEYFQTFNTTIDKICDNASLKNKQF